MRCHEFNASDLVFLDKLQTHVCNLNIKMNAERKNRFGGRRCCLCSAKAPVALHSFPKGDLKSLWKKICNYESFDDVSRLVVCAKHFTRDDYYQPDAKQYGRNLMLRPNRYPSVKVPNKIEVREEPVPVSFISPHGLITNVECVLEEVENITPIAPSEETTQLKFATMVHTFPSTSTTISENTGNSDDYQSDIAYCDMDADSDFAASSQDMNEKSSDKPSEDYQCTITKKYQVDSAADVSSLYDDHQSDMSFDDSDPDLIEDVNDTVPHNNNEDKQCTATVPKKYAKKLKQYRKKCRNTGREYTTITGKIVKERKSKPLTNCRNKCNEKITNNEKDKLFEDYWKLGSYDKRVSYIASMIDISNKKTMKINLNIPTEKNKHREVTYTYHVEIKEKRIIVCKKCFTDIFDENSKFITVTMTKKRAMGNSLEQTDKRGKAPPKHKHSEETRDLIMKHIDSFPAHESHSRKKYLGSDLNLSKMYRLYKETVPDPVGRTSYESVFRSLNLSFKKPKADTCEKCDSLNMKLAICTREEKIAIQNELHTHQQEAETAYNFKTG